MAMQSFVKEDAVKGCHSTRCERYLDQTSSWSQNNMYSSPKLKNRVKKVLSLYREERTIYSNTIKSFFFLLYRNKKASVCYNIMDCTIITMTLSHIWSYSKCKVIWGSSTLMHSDFSFELQLSPFNVNKPSNRVISTRLEFRVLKIVSSSILTRPDVYFTFWPFSQASLKSTRFV